MTDSLIAALPLHQIDVWIVDLCAFGEPSSMRTILSDDEIERADRFLRDEDSNNFVAARAALRQIVGRYAGVVAAEVKFVYGEFGKPSLNPESHESQFSFNLSHSLGQAVISVSHFHELGIDLEFASRITSPTTLVKAVLSANEQLQFEAIDANETEYLRRFVLQRWTMKEAFLKATGLGLTQSLKDIEFREIEPASDDATQLSDTTLVGPPKRNAILMQRKRQQNWIVEERSFDVDGSLSVAAHNTHANSTRQSFAIRLRSWHDKL